MFGWFKPTCPCDPVAKRWVEDRLSWLTKQFGLHILLERPVILPTSEFFPDKWDSSDKGGRLMFRRICEYMEIAPDSVKLEFFTGKTNPLSALDNSLGYAAGTWQEGTPTYDDESSDGIASFNPDSFRRGFKNESWRGGPDKKNLLRIERAILDRPSDVVGIMAHELAHQRLLGERRFDRNAFDNELLTDLTATFFGFGVFLANNPRKSTGELGFWPGTKLYKPEYISEPMLGYALAHIAWFRDEEWPAWAKALRWAPRSVFKQGLRYLRETADSTFKPVRLRLSRNEDE